MYPRSDSDSTCVTIHTSAGCIIIQLIVHLSKRRTQRSSPGSLRHSLQMWSHCPAKIRLVEQVEITEKAFSIAQRISSNSLPSSLSELTWRWCNHRHRLAFAFDWFVRDGISSDSPVELEESRRTHQSLFLVFFVERQSTWMNGLDAVVCLSNKVTASSVFDVGEPLFVAEEDTRIAFEALAIRMGWFSCEVDRRVKNAEESGERLVPVEFGGVRCLFGLSSVLKTRKNMSNRMTTPWRLPIVEEEDASLAAWLLLLLSF